MIYLHTIIGVAVIHFFAVSSPGPTLFVVASHANSEDSRAGWFVVLGVVAATVVWSSVAAAGLGTVVNAISWLPFAIRLLGGAYLAWFGIKMLRSAWKGGPEVDLNVKAGRTSPAASVRAGFVTNISNPKVIAYYVSLFGVMIPPESPPILFAAACLTAIVVSTVWWSMVSLFFRLPPVRRGFMRIRRVFDGIVGTALVLFGVKLIASR